MPGAWFALNEREDILEGYDRAAAFGPDPARQPFWMAQAAPLGRRRPGRAWDGRGVATAGAGAFTRFADHLAALPRRRSPSSVVQVAY
jgi:hypothetical protein